MFRPNHSTNLWPNLNHTSTNGLSEGHDSSCAIDNFDGRNFYCIQQSSTLFIYCKYNGTCHLNRQNLLLISVIYNIHFLGDLSVAWNNFLSTIPWDLKLCCIKSSKKEWLQTNYHNNHYNSPFPIVFIHPALHKSVLGTQVTTSTMWPNVHQS